MVDNFRLPLGTGAGWFARDLLHRIFEMALELADLKAYCNVTGNGDDALLARLLSAATAHIERLLGFKLDNTEELPNGAPADLGLAVLQLAADWYENREASLVGITGRPMPFGVHDIVNNYRRYTFGVCSNGE